MRNMDITCVHHMTCSLQSDLHTRGLRERQLQPARSRTLRATRAGQRSLRLRVCKSLTGARQERGGSTGPDRAVVALPAPPWRGYPGADCDTELEKLWSCFKTKRCEADCKRFCSVSRFALAQCRRRTATRRRGLADGVGKRDGAGPVAQRGLWHPSLGVCDSAVGPGGPWRNLGL